MPKWSGEKDDQAEETDAGTGFAGDTNARVHANSTASSRWNGAFHFLNVTIEEDAIIHAAWMDFSTASAALSEAGCRIYCEDVDDAANFTTTADVTSRTTTTASELWNDADVRWKTLTASVHYCRTIDFSGPVQEVINRSGWATGNDLMVIMHGESSGTNTLTVQDGTGNDQIWPKLHILYTAPGDLTSHEGAMY